MNIEIRLARAILNAQKIGEESHNRRGLNKILQDHKKLVDFDQFDSISMLKAAEAADKAASNAGFDLRMTQPIYLLNKFCWNEIQNWAKEIIKDEEE